MNIEQNYNDEEIEAMWSCIDDDMLLQEEIVPDVTLEEAESYFDLGYLEETPVYQEPA
ncbi:hypothetical protein [uncultured Pseudoteredinibacter sp.]|uniref:hypothetical protein n=1 Tax=uncultured Pseudoteredinibacter sp. TaxID=1641701 RepID=UPI00262A60D0|nr:hypothetical protein [uncultured Pseudoteredinibacter sp.]